MASTRGALASAVACAALGCQAWAGSVPSADLVLTGGRVWTADPTRPWAQAVAVRGDRIVYVGDDAGAALLRGPRTALVALGGRLVVPGFIDAHIHLVEAALTLDQVELAEEQGLAAVQARIRDFAGGEPGAWVLGRGWLYGSFPGGLPTKEQLDAAVPDRPAYMECYDYHTGWANSKALAAAGITKDTRDPEHGEIVRDPKTHEATGALKEDARTLVKAAIPADTEARRYALLLRAVQKLNFLGVTSVQDARSDSAPLASDLPLLERALAEDKLTVRMTAAVQMNPGGVEAAVAEAKRLALQHPAGRLRFGRVKAYVDGVIEAHTAALLAPYSDDPSFGLGRPNWTPEALDRAVVTADRAGLQVYLHAIGDRGVRMALDAHEAALRSNGPRDRRGRLEHIETIDPADIPRFKALGVMASMQPLHANPDQNLFDIWQRSVGPDRASRGFSWAAIQGAGARLVFGSDWPVVTPDVFRGLYCAVTRKTREGRPAGGWRPEQALSLEDALRHYTIDAAYASFDENETGSLGAGKKADLAVISRDLFEGPPEGILEATVLLTVMDGRVVHRAEGF